MLITTNKTMENDLNDLNDLKDFKNSNLIFLVGLMGCGKTTIGQLLAEKLHYEFVDTDENPRSLMLINDRWLIVAAQKGGTLESFELKRNESKGVLFETHFNYMIGEPVCMVHGREI